MDTPTNTPETRTAIRLLKLELETVGDDGAVKAVIGCIETLTRKCGLTLEQAAAVVKRDNPKVIGVVMDRIGLYPSSEPELRAVQKVWR